MKFLPLAILTLQAIACDQRLDAGYNRAQDAQAAAPFDLNGQVISLQLNGNATKPPNNQDGIDLTPATATQQGSAYLPLPLKLTAATTMSVFAEFAIESSGNDGEGVAFVWHSDPKGILALGGTGGDISISNIKPSLAVVFDTHNGNGRELAPNVCIGHGGDFSVKPIATRPPPFSLATGRSIFVWIEYGTKGCQVYVSDSPEHPTSPWIEAPIDLRAELGDSVFFGVASSTGAAFSRHRLLQLHVRVLP